MRTLVNLIVFYLILLTILAKPNLLNAQEVSFETIDYSLPYPGILPDHPLYSFKKIRDYLLILLTHDDIKKTELFLLLADKHLVMGNLLWEKEKYSLSLETWRKGEQYLLQSSKKLLDSKNKNMASVGMIGKMETAVKKHQETIEAISTPVTTFKESSYQEEFDKLQILNHQALQIVRSTME